MLDVRGIGRFGDAAGNNYITIRHDGSNSSINNYGNGSLLLNWYSGKNTIVGGGGSGYNCPNTGSFEAQYYSYLATKSGDVGIGTTSPTQKLQVDGGNILVHGVGNFNVSGNEAYMYVGASTYNVKSKYGTGLSFSVPSVSDAMFIEEGTGNVGIGTTNADQKLVVKGGISIYNPNDDGNIALFFGREHASNTYGKWGIQYVSAGEIGTNALAGLNFKIPNSGNNYLFLADNGNILIGKNLQGNNNYKLDVNGIIRANEIVVNTNGADYVFENNYKLMSLNQLEKSILENKRLPGIPSSEEMQKNGITIGETNTLLLQKIEELTLYLIDQNKKIESIQNENMQLKIRVSDLEKK